MNRKILYTAAGEQFEIQRKPWGQFALYQLDDKGRIILKRIHSSVLSLFEEMASLGIFAKEDAQTFSEIHDTLNEILSTLKHHLQVYSHDD